MVCVLGVCVGAGGKVPSTVSDAQKNLNKYEHFSFIGCGKTVVTRATGLPCPWACLLLGLR